MPTYQYRCTECGHDLEAVQKFSDASLTQCPSCGGQLRKIFNAVGVVFKGSGFYRTDSRDASASGSDKAGSDKSSVDAKGKDSGGKDSGGKESGGKDSGGKESGSKESGGKDAKKSGSGDGGSSPAKADAPQGGSTKHGTKTPASTGSKPSSG